jgi:hypothetical protein
MTLIGGYTNPRFRDAFNAANTPDVPLDFERFFVQTESWGAGRWAEAVTAVKAGRTPIISTKLTGSWLDASKGSNNTRLDAAVNGLVAQDITKLLRVPLLVVHHEPEGDGTVADFNAMQKFMFGRYAAKLRAAGWDMGIITMGGTLMGWTKWTPTQLDQALAGIDVKRVHSDIYEKPGETNGVATKPWTDPSSTSSPHRKYLDWCKSHGYIAAMPECGVLKHVSDTTFQASFLDSLAGWDRSNEYEYVIYYDRMPGEGGATNNCAIFDSPTALRSFAKLYDAAVVVPPPASDCSEVEAELAAVKVELANQEQANDDLITELAKTQGERDAALERLAQIHTLSA